MSVLLGVSVAANVLLLVACWRFGRAARHWRQEWRAASTVVEELTKAMERKLGSKKAGRVVYGMIQNIRNQRLTEQVGLTEGGRDGAN